ncbi:MAG: methyltransferase [Alsobacter sp.]
MADPDGLPLFAGRVRLLQPRTGHRAGTDAVLLAAAAPLADVSTAVDLGAGVGAVGLCYAADNRTAQVRLLELDPDAAGFARENIALNALGDRVTVEEGDALAVARDAGLADLVLTNPPYLAAGRARSVEAKQRAHVMPEGGLEAWVTAALRRLSPRGRLVMIHRAEALPDILRALEGRFGRVSVLPVQPRAEAPAIRILVHAVKGSRGPFRLLPPLVLHEATGDFTPLAAALHKGEARCSWDG